MNVFFNRVILLILFVCFVLAADARGNSLVSEPVYHSLTKVERLLQEGKYAEAQQHLDTFSRSRSALNAYEQALIDQISGVIYANMENYLEAGNSFERALRSGQLPDGLQQQTYYNLAQIYLFREQYRQAETLIKEELLSDTQPGSPNIYFMLANVYVGMNDPRQALEWSKKSLQNISDDTPESYFALAISLNLTLEAYTQAAILLEQVLERVPERVSYWRQLAAVRLELDQPTQALATLELGYLQGTLRERRDLMQLSRLYINVGLPYKGGAVLEHGIRDGLIKTDQEVYELLAAAWNNAREYERAIVPLTKAAELSEDGELFLQLAHIYVEEEDWLAAQSAIKQALDKGEIKKPHEACFIQGVIYTHLEQYETAESIFIECLDFDDNRDQVIEWLEFLGANHS